VRTDTSYLTAARSVIRSVVRRFDACINGTIRPSVFAGSQPDEVARTVDCDTVSRHCLATSVGLCQYRRGIHTAFERIWYHRRGIATAQYG